MLEYISEELLCLSRLIPIPHLIQQRHRWRYNLLLFVGPLYVTSSYSALPTLFFLNYIYT
jgi:hypothetical protein